MKSHSRHLGSFFSNLVLGCVLVFLSGCGYRFEGSENSETVMTISVPYVKGDLEGLFNAELSRALSSSGQFECVQNGGMLLLESSILSDGDSRIGYRYDRNPTTGKLRDNIVGTENRRTVSVVVTLKDAYTQDVLIGPLVVSASADYDYVDSNSVRDLVFFEPNSMPQKVLDFSLGQLDSVEGAHDDTSSLIYAILAQKIVDGIVVQTACNYSAKKENEKGEKAPEMPVDKDLEEPIAD